VKLVNQSYGVLSAVPFCILKEMHRVYLQNVATKWLLMSTFKLKHKKTGHKGNMLVESQALEQVFGATARAEAECVRLEL